MQALNDWLKGVMLKPGNSDLAIGEWSTDGLFMFITWLCIISFVFVMAPMFWWAYKYRRRDGRAAQRTPNHNTALEVTWVVVPLLLLVVVFFWGFKGYMRGQVAKGNAEIINLEGYKWAWEAQYRNGVPSGQQVYLDDRRAPNEKGELVGPRGNYLFPVIAVPEDKPVKFIMKSRDVMHSFYIPDMRIKMDLFPNRYTSLTFIPQDAGGPEGNNDQAGAVTKTPGEIPGRDHFVFCAEYCGQSHSEMAAVLRVMTTTNFEKALETWGDLYKGKTFSEVGAIVYARKCATCHSIDGGKNTGPTWKGVWGTDVPLANGSTVKYDENYTRESILNPAAKIHQGYPNQMPSFAGQLTDNEILGVIAYIRELSGKTTDADKAPFPSK
jgi:cytochrome c oxidase subunit 2